MAVMHLANPNQQPARFSFRPGVGPAGDVLVMLLLRGGMDGLHAVPPHGDEQFGKIRRKHALVQPGRSGGIIDLDGFYGLHPDLAPLEELYRERSLAIVHACGSPDHTLSHFEATITLERGVDDGSSVGSGWLSRHLHTSGSSNTSPIRGLALSRIMPALLAGAPNAIAMPSVADFRLNLPAGWEPNFTRELAALYAETDSQESDAGLASVRLFRDLAKIRAERSRSRNGADYPDHSLGRNFSELAQLIRAEVGLEVAVLELGGWDTHLGQVPQMSRQMNSLSASLLAFARDLGDLMKRVVVVAISEFGRRVYENSAEGTDHGRGTAMFILGGGIRGGRVYGSWPGLARDQLDGDGNLHITTDYRHVLAEIVERRLLNPQVQHAFPEFAAKCIDVCI
jgi:uncharacterized protein (DUF1501 family)